MVFPGAIEGSQLSDMALLEVVRGMEVAVTVHGFRSSFRDWAAEETEVADAVAEASLAHAVEGKTKAAYLRTNFFMKRRELMQHWANYCVPSARAVADTRIPRKPTPSQKSGFRPAARSASAPRGAATR